MNFDENIEILKVDFECSQCNKINQEGKPVPLRRIIEKLDGFFDKNDLSGAKKLLEYWKNEAMRNNDLSGELSIVNEMLGLYRKIADKENGEMAITRAAELLKLTNNESTISGATIFINLATSCNAFNNPEKAVLFYEKAEEIYQKQGLPQSDLRYAALYNNYATTLGDIKNYDKAKELYEKAIGITSKSMEGLLDSAVSYVNLAHLYDEWQGELCEEIEECLKKAEEILQDGRIKHNSYYAFVCEKCAPSFSYFGYFVFAKKLRDEAREIYERA